MPYFALIIMYYHDKIACYHNLNPICPKSRNQYSPNQMSKLGFRDTKKGISPTKQMMKIKIETTRIDCDFKIIEFTKREYV